MKSGGVSVVVLSILAVLGSLDGACSSDPASGGGSAGAGGGEVCPDDLECPAEKACLHTNCVAEMDAIESATGPCGSVVSCDAACHCDQACKDACESNLGTDCQTAYANAVACGHEQCEATSCPDEDGDDDGEGGESGDGGHGAGGQGAGGHGAGGQGGATSSSGVPYSCYLANGFTCTQVKAPASAVAMGQATCDANGGVSGTMCPTDGVYGCCVNSGNASCDYDGIDWTLGDTINPANECAKGGGTWVSSPPVQ